eukprot:TRINITY_DN50986_c0_g1_i2.p1 TRINITY_DN50986_c0_g1~~TRINITY_DN50986_c0_g1_i2.p1  ORF type:complete len:164 (-),score=9.94 TRINITY_DN50986_c0_g1_i2:55-546(-)
MAGPSARCRLLASRFLASHRRSFGRVAAVVATRFSARLALPSVAGAGALLLLSRKHLATVRAEAEPEWITTPSGLQYHDVAVGEGAMPTKGQTVKVHYTGRLTNGKQFDSSIPRGQPLEFAVGTGMVIPGWDEGILTMRVGGMRKLKIPPQLGYCSLVHGLRE